MADVVYSIRDWDEHFEVSQSRRSTKRNQRNHWVAIPNKHDGKGYRRIMRRADAGDIFTAWVLIAQVASKCPVRGVLADEDGPLTPEDLEIKTGFREAVFQDALAYLSSDEIGWLESSQIADGARSERGQATGQDRTRQDRTGQIDCAETDEPSSAPPADCQPFPCDGTKREWRLMQAKLDEWQSAYPSLDCLHECRKARQWLLDNPTRRKTHGGMTRFIGNWLAREQNSTRGSPGRSERSTPAIPKLGGKQ